VKDFSPDYQDIGTLKDSDTDLNSFQVKKEQLEKEWDPAHKYQFPTRYVISCTYDVHKLKMRFSQRSFQKCMFV
jgi:hypothetical protein